MSFDWSHAILATCSFEETIVFLSSVWISQSPFAFVSCGQRWSLKSKHAHRAHQVHTNAHSNAHSLVKELWKQQHVFVYRKGRNVRLVALLSPLPVGINPPPSSSLPDRPLAFYPFSVNSWIPWNLSFRYIHCTGQFTPKMKANAIPRLLSSLAWIDQYNECNGMTSFMEFMSWVSPDFSSPLNNSNKLKSCRQHADVVRMLCTQLFLKNWRGGSLPNYRTLKFGSTWCFIWFMHTTVWFYVKWISTQ